jgi:hypothetical protein
VTPHSRKKGRGIAVAANWLRESPGNRVIEAVNMSDKQFSPERLEQLIKKWLDGVEPFWRNYQERCELVYAIWKETAKPGCKGGFSAVLARMGLPDSTAYDMIFRHQIKIGERPDPAAPDPRDEEDEESEQSSVGEGPAPTGPTPTGPASRNASREQPTRAPKVVLTLKGEFGSAVKDSRASYGYKDDKTAIIESVLSIRHQLAGPLLRCAVGEQTVAMKAGEISDAA